MIRILGLRPSPTTTASTLAFERYGLPTSMVFSSARRSILSNTIFPPSSEASFSTRSFWFLETRYCFPPVSITANIEASLVGVGCLVKQHDLRSDFLAAYFENVFINFAELTACLIIRVHGCIEVPAYFFKVIIVCAEMIPKKSYVFNNLFC